MLSVLAMWMHAVTTKWKYSTTMNPVTKCTKIKGGTRSLPKKM